MKITWFGTASIAIETQNSKILFDPFFRRNKNLPQSDIRNFVGYDALFVTHGHFDHFLDVPKVLKADRNVEAYCTKTPRAILFNQGFSYSRVHLITPGDEINIGDIQIKVHKGNHVDFNMEYITGVVPSAVFQFYRSLPLLRYIKTLPENHEIVIYEVKAEGKTALIMGSYGINAEEIYPTNIDCLIFPYAGNTNIPSMAAGMLRALKPKTVFFDHFDDAFPPFTIRMDVEGYCKILKRVMPEVNLIIPKEDRTYEI